MNEGDSPTVIMQHLAVTGIVAFAACSDGKLRRVVLTEREATKLVSLLTHKVFGGILRLEQKPVSRA